ncbi:MAG: hypothetical protein AB8G77_03895 [Rhodothermales bacterium]
MSVVSLRIGDADTAVPDERRTHMWMSYDDAARLVIASLEQTECEHLAVYAAADCPEPFSHNTEAKFLVASVQDDPRDLLLSPELLTEKPATGLSVVFVGGVYAEADYRGDTWFTDACGKPIDRTR